VEVVDREAHPDAGVLSVEAPRAAVGGDTVEVRVRVQAGAAGSGASSLDLLLGERRAARAPLEPLAPFSERSFALSVPVPNGDGERLLRAVIAAGDGDMETVVVRPRFVWGAGDTTLLPAMTEMVRAGRFRWIGGGRHLTSTTHVANAVEGLILAAERGRPGNAYFVTDGSPVVFREFVSTLLATQGVQAPDGTVPLPVARALAVTCETAWRLLPLPGEPPVARFAVWASGLECTIDDSKAREQLGYEPVIDRTTGMAALRGRLQDAVATGV
jgi:nucleoside-diphosphate-sugar epimerase